MLRSLALRGHPLRRLADDFPRARDAELFLNIGPVSFNGFFTQMQLARNLVHVVSFADQLENFQFPIRQALDRAATLRLGLGYGYKAFACSSRD